jgi:hypothetical protein
VAAAWHCHAAVVVGYHQTLRKTATVQHIIAHIKELTYSTSTNFIRLENSVRAIPLDFNGELVQHTYHCQSTPLPQNNYKTHKYDCAMTGKDATNAPRA